jgi:hypothetical protein
MKNKQRITKLEVSTKAQTPLTREEYKLKYETYVNRLVELFEYSKNQKEPFSDEMYQEYLKQWKKSPKMTWKEKRELFKQRKEEILKALDEESYQ